jgi:hypothetical protein
MIHVKKVFHSNLVNYFYIFNHIFNNYTISLSISKINTLQARLAVINTKKLSFFMLDIQALLEYYFYAHKFVFVINQIFKSNGNN